MSGNLSNERNSKIEKINNILLIYLNNLYSAGVNSRIAKQESRRIIELIGKGDDEVNTFTLHEAQSEDEEFLNRIKKALIAFNAAFAETSTNSQLEDYIDSFKERADAIRHYLYSMNQHGGKRYVTIKNKKKQRMSQSKQNQLRKTRTKTMNTNWLRRRVNSLTLRNLQREESYLTEKE